ncbi:MAG: hypothetical protein NTY38_03525 [Acidobacteria bacterium]|nr:hypothetical protein [Acidobacteriota bacterium]
MSPARLAYGFLLAVCGASLSYAQAIEFESGGMKYQSLSRNGITVMFSHLPTHVREYSVIQVAISNGSPIPQAVKPEDFIYEREAGERIAATPARAVVLELIEKARRGDVIKLVTMYEQGLYGTTRINSTNGYEQRRQAALAEVQSTKLKAGAAASAIALVPGRLAVGESTDGAVFFATAGKPIGPGRLTFRAGGESFQFRFTQAN